MKKWWIGLLLLAVVLAAANLWLTLRPPAQEPQFLIDPAEVVRVEYRRYDRASDGADGIPTAFKAPTYRFQPEDIPLICDVLSTLFVREFPMDAADETWRRHAIGDCFHSCYVFYMTDGSTRVFNGGGHLACFDGHWCYVSGGEAYGYKPIFSLLSNAHNNAERIEEGSP